jgi:ABC-type dipeptide/oligopeptide/nickel transport system permease subunit
LGDGGARKDPSQVVLGPGLVSVIVALGITRSLVLSLRERELVTAATLIVGSDAYSVRRHVLVNLLGDALRGTLDPTVRD